MPTTLAAHSRRVRHQPTRLCCLLQCSCWTSCTLNPRATVAKVILGGGTTKKLDFADGRSEFSDGVFSGIEERREIGSWQVKFIAACCCCQPVLCIPTEKPLRPFVYCPPLYRIISENLFEDDGPRYVSPWISPSLGYYYQRPNETRQLLRRAVGH